MNDEIQRFRYHRVLTACAMQPWAVTAQHMEVVRDVLLFQASGGKLSDEEVASIVSASRPGRAQSRGAVAVLSMRGTISHRIEAVQELSGAGGTSVERFRQRFHSAVNDSNVSAIVVDVDSPGGAVAGVRELADEIYAARGKKPMVAVANTLAASAAYWLGTAFPEFSVTDSGHVGSIGVFTMHQDVSKALEKDGVAVTLVHAGKYKVEGNPFTALDQDARDYLQAQVDSTYEEFVGAVARHRGASRKQVVSEFGEGRLVRAREAVDRGMADRIETIEEAIQRLGGNAAPRRRRMAAAIAAAGVA